jgi:hypothetical protein
MSPAQLEELERALGLTLPQEYRAALLEYPLPRDQHSTELWLCDDPAELQELNRGWRAEGHPPQMVLIGSDGGEESYVLDTSQAPFPVLAYSCETGRLEGCADSFAGFVDRQRREYEAIEADRRRCMRRTRTSAGGSSGSDHDGGHGAAGRRTSCSFCTGASSRCFSVFGRSPRPQASGMSRCRRPKWSESARSATESPRRARWPAAGCRYQLRC